MTEADIAHISAVGMCEEIPEWHAAHTIQLGELIEGLFFDLKDEEAWPWDYYDIAQRDRLADKITEHFYYREIALTPPGRWKREFLRKLNEIMPKYKPLYDYIKDGFNPLITGDEYGKSRNIQSDFPQTLLSGNQDYATTGQDREYEIMRQGNIAEVVDKYYKTYRDVDLLIISEMDCMFTCILTVGAISY